MKHITISIMVILPLSLYSVSLSHQEITKMVTKIKDERAGIGLEILDNTPNPFAIVEEVEKKVEEIKVEKPKEKSVVTVSYQITAVLNHAAFINKKWYRVGDKLGVYKVTHVGKSSVTLKSGREVKQLVIPQKKKKFKMFKGN